MLWQLVLKQLFWLTHFSSHLSLTASRTETKLWRKREQAALTQCVTDRKQDCVRDRQKSWLANVEVICFLHVVNEISRLTIEYMFFVVEGNEILTDAFCCVKDFILLSIDSLFMFMTYFKYHLLCSTWQVVLFILYMFLCADDENLYLNFRKKN